MSENTNDNQKKNPTPEEIAEHKKKMEEFYDKELPFLRKKEEFERLNSHIAQHRLNEEMATMKLAQLYQSSKPAPAENKKD